MGETRRRGRRRSTGRRRRRGREGSRGAGAGRGRWGWGRDWGLGGGVGEGMEGPDERMVGVEGQLVERRYMVDDRDVVEESRKELVEEVGRDRS